MDLLVSNDDGIDAHGIAVLAEAMSALGTVWVVAPTHEHSAQSHALTMSGPLRVEERGPRRFAVSGTPADSSYLALHEVLPVRPRLTVSGINHGTNLGQDVHYSGTVAAALESVIQGVPAVAVSLEMARDTSQHHWDTAAHVATEVVKRVLALERIPPRLCLNVNVPDVPVAELQGLRTTTLGEREYEPGVDTRVDPRGRHYYWLGGPHTAFVDLPGSDGPAFEKSWATITPLQVDMTAHDQLAAVREWMGG